MKDDKLKVFAIIPSGFCFGLQHVTIDFFKRFDQTDSLFLVTGWNNGDFIKLLKANGLRYTISWLGMFSRSLAWNNVKMSSHALIRLPKLYFDFFRVLRTFKPDVLYFANHHELILLYPVLKITKLPIVCHMHDPAPIIAFQKKSFSFYSSVVNQFIAISESVRERTIQLGCPPEKITTLHNGINMPHHSRLERVNTFCERFNWGSDVFIIGITGQMTATKGHMDLLEAFKIAYQQNSKLRLVIGGIAMEPLYSELKVRINDWRIEGAVAFSGWMPSINTFFEGIDAFVLASRHDEGYGLVVAEAMANSVPVIITASGGAVEIVRDNLNGFIVPKGDVKLIAEKIIFLATNTVLCTDMGNVARQFISLNFNINAQAVALQALLFKIKENALRP